jgi:hypothetical protein
MSRSLQSAGLALLGLCAACLGPGSLRAEEAPLLLREAFPAGYQYHVSCRVELSGNLGLPAEKAGTPPRSLTVTGTSAIEYDERVLSAGKDGQVDKTMRVYRRIDFQRKVGDRPQESTIRPGVRRLVVLRHENAEVPFSPDGPLTWGEIDLVRTDVFTPALTGMLPDKAVAIGDRWKATKASIQELTDMERIEEGEVECRFDQVTTLSNRRHARISFSGTVRGINEDGPNRQQLEGHFFFDLESHHISYLSLQGVSSLLDKDGKVLGAVEGRFVLTRQAHNRVAELSDAGLRGVNTEPDGENTLLLYENAELGIRFLHPRRWHVAGVRGQQVALDEANGNGVLVTVEPPERVPKAAQFLAESRDWLEKQKATIVRVEEPRSLRANSQELEHFAIDAEIAGQKVLMDYYVSRQAAGGATLAARLLPADAAALTREIERIARSLQVAKKASGP